MLPEIWFEVTRENNSYSKALLDGFFRSKLKGEVYPGIYRKIGRSVDGLIYYDVSPFAIEKLDIFEGERYQRIKINVTVNRHSFQAETYELSTAYHYLITDEKWSLEEFIRSGNDHFKDNYIGFKRI